MSELLAEWAAWQTWRGLSARTVNTRGHVVRRFAGFVAPADIFDVDDGDVLRFLSGPISSRTRGQYLSHLSTFYKWAIDRGLTDFDPTAGIQRPKQPRGIPRPVEHDDAVRAIAVAGPRMRAWLLLAVLAGLRAVEIARLDAGDVGADVLRLDGKGGAERRVPLHPLVADALAEAPPPYGLTASRISDKVGDFLEGLGVDATLHQFRHRFATDVYAASGFDLLVTSELLGHASVATTQIYTRVDRTRAAEAVGRLTLGGSGRAVPLEDFGDAGVGEAGRVGDGAKRRSFLSELDDEPFPLGRVADEAGGDPAQLRFGAGLFGHRWSPS